MTESFDIWKALVVEVASVLGEADEHRHVGGVVGVHGGLFRGDFKPLLVIEKREADFQPSVLQFRFSLQVVDDIIEDDGACWLE